LAQSPRKKIKTISLLQLREAFRLSVLAKENKISDTQVLIDEARAHRISRRKFIGDTAKTAALVGALGLYQACASSNDKSNTSVVIVGAGIAGLHAGYILKQAGYSVQIFEGSPRVGGRIYTVQNMMGDGLWTEMGGEFIDTDHEDMIALANHFNLPLLDRHAASELQLEEYAYYFNKTHYHLADIIEELNPYADKIKKDIVSISDEITFEKHSAIDKKFDNMSIMEYVDQLGMYGWFRDFINYAFTPEYGMEATEQSALNLLTVLDPGDGMNYHLYGSSDERFSVIGGNQKICNALANEMEDQIQANQILTAISKNNNQYALNFESNGNSKVVWADFVLLALPFTKLREVDIQFTLPEWKMNAIKNIGYGTNAKLFAGVNDRVWRKQNYTGYAFSDNGMMNGYDHTQMQNNNIGAGGYTIFLGGKAGVDCGNKGLDELESQYIPALDSIFPGVKNSFNKNFQMWHWPSYAFSKGSYVCYKVGQYTTMSGAAIKPVDNLFFAGEHCSYANQGFMNGGAETGRKAAEAIMAKLV
jgi:monoamine oxidase